MDFERNETNQKDASLILKRPFIKDVINQGEGRGFAKRLSYLISLFSKSDDELGRGVE